jgi:hypothetical protein
MFMGFKQKYPEYEVITPQTNQSFRLRSLTVQEEERLKSSLLSPSIVTDHLNRCIFDCIVVKPESIKSYDDFLLQCSMKDRDALLYGLYHITYEEVRNYDISCGSCRKTHPVTLKISDAFSVNPFPTDRNILTENYDVTLPVLSNVFVSIRQPTLKDEVDAMKLAGNNTKLLDIMTETMIINTITENSDAEDSTIYSSRDDIVDAYRALPPNDKRAIFKEYSDKMGQYGIELKARVNCVHCGEEEHIDLDLVDNFFRMVHTLE